MAYSTIDDVRRQVAVARGDLVRTGERSKTIKLPQPYAKVTVHANGMVTTAETNMRVFSLEVTP